MFSDNNKYSQLKCDVRGLNKFDWSKIYNWQLTVIAKWR